MKLKDFVAKKGVFAQHLCKMFSHKHRVRVLGKDYKKRSIYFSMNGY